MGWEALEKRPQSDDTAKRRFEAREKALRTAARQTLGTDEAAPVREYLQAVIDANVYQPGMTLDAVANSDGMRKLARILLNLLEDKR